MNKLTITILITGLGLLTGCNKWLDVKPEGQSTRDQMFQTQKGFRDALTGAYLDLKSGDAYGHALTWGTIEYLARNWDVIATSNTTLNNLVAANYNDAGVKERIASIYAKEYKIIADVNSILEFIDGKKNIFQDDNYSLIKGEALALRAFAHFDVLRMFGPMPDNPGGINVLPYVTEVSKNIVPLSNFDMFAAQVIRDLDEAEALLKDVDPITKFTIAELNPDPNYTGETVVRDNFYLYRQVRLNYYAVLALKARVYNWLAPRGDANRTNAVKYAKMVIDAKDAAGQPVFTLGGLSETQLGNYTMPTEQIAALSVHDLKIQAENNFDEKGQLARYDLAIQDNYYYINFLFPVGERATDARWVGLWSYKTTSGQSNFVKYKKYTQKETNPLLQIPLIRLSEMYLILTETATGKAEAESYYSIYCERKGIPFTNGFNASGWENDRRNKMIREYVREFYAEGQTFFTYKRYNVSTLPASWTSAYYNATPARYIVPKPDREITYNNN
jgi:hypothetical protein